MVKRLSVNLAMMIMIVPLISHSKSNVHFDETLVQIVNQLNAITPLIEKAKHYQSKNTRVQLHLTKFKGSDGNIHNGLSEDISEIKKGIVAYLNKPTIEPRTIKPLDDDFNDL
jgi:RAQPRD family integrative conjugative element protein